MSTDLSPRTVAAALSALFPSRPEARTLLTAMGRQSAMPTLDGDIATMWDRVADVADAQGWLEPLLDAALGRFPNSERLHALRASSQYIAAVASPAAGPRFARLTSDQWHTLQKAFAEVFSDYNGLRHFVQSELGENLHGIAHSQNLNTALYDLIQWSQVRGLTDKLFRAVRKTYPEQKALAALDR